MGASPQVRYRLLSREVLSSLLSPEALGMCCSLAGFAVVVGMKEMQVVGIVGIELERSVIVLKKG